MWPVCGENIIRNKLFSIETSRGKNEKKIGLGLGKNTEKYQDSLAE